MLKRYSVVVVCALLTGALFTGCAKQEFSKLEATVTAASVGFRELPAKVDILVVPDNSGSVGVAINTIQSNFSGFVSGLQSQYWDYHVAQATIWNPQPITNSAVLVNPQFNSSTLSDGTTINNPGIVPGAMTNASQFVLNNSIYSNATTHDPTYSTIFNVINNAKANTNFLRSDALLAVIVITNGFEGSVTTDQFGATINQTALYNAAQNLLSLKNYDNRMIRFYPVAANGYHQGTSSDYCLQPYSPSLNGDSYFLMNSYIPGLSKSTLDFCNPSALTNVLTAMNNDLQAVKQAYVYSNIVLNEAPIDSTLVVTKNGRALTKDDPNGFTYLGKQTVYTITGIADPANCPTQNISDSSCVITPLTPGLNQETGYVIRLNGTGRMLGKDVPGVSYQAL